jgi:hypothetical protein
MAWSDEVSTGSGSDRVTVLAISIDAGGGNPVATAPGTDSLIDLANRWDITKCLGA